MYCKINTVDADVEILAVSGISVQWVGDEGTSLVAFLDLSRAVELNDI